MNWKTLGVCAVFACALASHAAAQQPQAITPDSHVNQGNAMVSEVPDTDGKHSVEYVESIKVPAASSSVRAPKSRGTIYLTPGSTKIVRFVEDAASVVVANPAHVSVFLDTPRTGIIMPRSPGATSFSVLGEDGNVLMTKNVVISDSDENYVRIRRICGGTDNCQESTVYYCDGNCVEVTVNRGNSGQQSAFR